MFQLAEMVRPRLVEDGMFLVGLDIVGDKLMEINVFSPGGLGSAQKFEKVNFTHAVLEALERKVQYMKLLSSQLQQRGVGDTLNTSSKRSACLRVCLVTTGEEACHTKGFFR